MRNSMFTGNQFDEYKFKWKLSTRLVHVHSLCNQVLCCNKTGNFKTKLKKKQYPCDSIQFALFSMHAFVLKQPFGFVNWARSGGRARGNQFDQSDFWLLTFAIMNEIVMNVFILNRVYAYGIVTVVVRQNFVALWSFAHCVRWCIFIDNILTWMVLSGRFVVFLK